MSLPNPFLCRCPRLGACINVCDADENSVAVDADKSSTIPADKDEARDKVQVGWQHKCGSPQNCSSSPSLSKAVQVIDNCHLNLELLDSSLRQHFCCI
jgi:hypothetical protein